MEGSTNREADPQLVLDQVAHGDVVRKPELIARLHKSSVPAQIMISATLLEVTHTARGAMRRARGREMQKPAPPVANQNEEF